MARLALAIFLLLAGAASARQNDATWRGAVLQPPWGIHCERQADQGKICYAYQVQQNQSVTLLQVVVGYLAEGGRPRMIVTVPLGVLLPAGLILKIDQEKEFTAPITTCVAGGCQVILDMDRAGLDSLRRGNQVRIRYQMVNRQAIEIPVRLEGLAAALNSLAK